MKFERIEYLVGDLPGLPQSLSIDESGRARYDSHTNWSTLDHPEIGVYEVTLNPAELRSLEDVLGHPPLAGMPDHTGRVRSGDRHCRIRVTAGSETSEKLIGTEEPVDPRLARVVNALDGIVAEVMRHALQTVRVQLIEAETAEGSLTATMRMSNQGSQPVAARSPLDLIGREDGSLALHFWPDVRGPKEMATLPIRKVEDLGPGEEERPDARVVVIPPGGSVTFRIVARLPESAEGSHECRISYSNFADELGDLQLVQGQVISTTVTVTLP